MEKPNFSHPFHHNKIDNYDDLQKEYFKHAQINDYYKNIDYSTPVKEIEPLAPLDSNFFSKNTPPSDAPKHSPHPFINDYSREKELQKERTRQKQLEYQKYLNQQIAEKKRRKQEEEASRLREEMQYEQKYNKQFQQNQNYLKHSNGGNININKDNKMEAMTELINDHPHLEGILKKMTAQQNDNNDLHNSNENNMRVNVSQYNQGYNNINEYNDVNVSKSNYIQPNVNVQQYQRDNNEYSMYYNEQNAQQGRNLQQYVQSPHRMNYSSPNVLNDIALAQQRNHMNMGNGVPMTNVSVSNNNICRISNIEQQYPQYNRPTTPVYNANPNNCSFPNVAMSSPNVNMSAMMNNNINNGYNNMSTNTNFYQPQMQPPQVNNPYQYPQILDKMLDFVLQEQVKIINDYKLTIEQLKNERDQALYMNRANEEKIQALQRIQDKQAMIENKFGYSPFDQQYRNTLEEKLNHMMERSDANIKNNSNNAEYNYKSKYEERFEQTTDNFKGSLIGSTKFVKQTGQKKLLETWVNDDEVNNMNFDDEFKYQNIRNNNKSNFYMNGNNSNSKYTNNFNNVNQHNVLQTNVNINDISEIVRKDNKSESGDEDDEDNKNYIQNLNVNNSFKKEINPIPNITKNKRKVIENKDNNIELNIHNKIIDNMENIDDNVNIDEQNKSIEHNSKTNNVKSDNFTIENNNNEDQFNIEQQDHSDKDDDLCIISKHSLHNNNMTQKDNGYITSSEDEDDKHNDSIRNEISINNKVNPKDNEEHIPEIIENQPQVETINNDNNKQIKVNRSNMIMGDFNNNSNFDGLIRLSNNSEPKHEDEEDIPIEIETENDNTEDHYQIPSHNSTSKTNINNNQDTFKHNNNESTINSNIILIPREQIQTNSIRRNPFTFANTLKQKLNQDESKLNANNNNTINTNPNENNISTIKNINNNNDVFLEEEIEEEPHFYNEKEQSQIISHNEPQNEVQNESNAELLKRMTYFDDDDNGGIDSANKLMNSNTRFSNKARYPRGVTSKDINNLNSIFDKFKKKKQDQRSSRDESEQSLKSLSRLNGSIDKNKSINNDNSDIINNGSLMNESLNTFNNNLNDNNYFKVKEEEKIMQKVNKLTKVAINEIGQSQLSVFKNPNEKHPL